MAKYSEAQEQLTTNLKPVATSGINKPIVIGYPEEFMWVSDSVSFSSIDEIKDIDTFNDLIVSGDAVYLGKYEVESAGSDKEVYERNYFNIRETITEATKVLRCASPVGSMVGSELEKINGRSGRIIELTSNGYLVARYNDDKTIVGRPLTNIEKDQNTVPTREKPDSDVVLEISYSDPRGDQQNPFEAKVDWKFSQVDQPILVDITIDESTYTPGASDVTFNATFSIGIGETALEGITASNIHLEDANGAEVTVNSLTATGTAGEYTVNGASTDSVVYLSIKDIQKIGVLPYLSELVEAKSDS